MCALFICIWNICGCCHKNHIFIISLYTDWNRCFIFLLLLASFKGVSITIAWRLFQIIFSETQQTYCDCKCVDFSFAFKLACSLNFRFVSYFNILLRLLQSLDWNLQFLELRFLVFLLFLFFFKYCTNKFCPIECMLLTRNFCMRCSIGRICDWTKINKKKCIASWRIFFFKYDIS